MTDLAPRFGTVVPSPFGDMAVEYYGYYSGVVSCRPAGRGQWSDFCRLDAAPPASSFLSEMAELLTLRNRMPEGWLPEHPVFPGLWRALWEIPLGETRSYSDICGRLGLPPRRYARAVAGVIGTNPLCLLIPCHRVIMSNGELGGYRWGTELKKKILDYEQQLAGRH